MKKLTKFVLMDHTEGMTLKDVVNHRGIKDKIYDHIMEKFTKGQKLESFHRYTEPDYVRSLNKDNFVKQDTKKEIDPSK